MKKLVVSRYAEFSDSTLSHVELYDEKDNRIYTCYGLEPAGPDTQEANQDRRVLQGTYNATWEASNMSGNALFQGKLPTLYNDKCSKNRKIKIHIGNYGKDTLGCLLLGTGANARYGYVNNSKVAVTAVLNHLKYDDFIVEIKNAF